VDVWSGLSQERSVCLFVVWGFVPLAVVEYYGECSSPYREVFIGEDQDVVSLHIRFVIRADIDNPPIVYNVLIKKGYCGLVEVYPCRSRARLGRHEKYK